MPRTRSRSSASVSLTSRWACSRAAAASGSLDALRRALPSSTPSATSRCWAPSCRSRSMRRRSSSAAPTAAVRVCVSCTARPSAFAARVCACRAASTASARADDPTRARAVRTIASEPACTSSAVTQRSSAAAGTMRTSGTGGSPMPLASATTRVDEATDREPAGDAHQHALHREDEPGDHDVRGVRPGPAVGQHAAPGGPRALTVRVARRGDLDRQLRVQPRSLQPSERPAEPQGGDEQRDADEQDQEAQRERHRDGEGEEREQQDDGADDELRDTPPGRDGHGRRERAPARPRRRGRRPAGRRTRCPEASVRS